MLPSIIYHLILVVVCGYALCFGRFDERATAIMCLAATFATRIGLSPLTHRYSSIELGVLIVDITVFLAFTYVALRSDKLWPLWVSGLQLTTTIAHLMKAIDPGMAPQADAAAGRFWSYPILMIFAIATYRTNKGARYRSRRVRSGCSLRK